MKKTTIKGISINELSYPLPRPVEVESGNTNFDIWNTMMSMRVEWQKDYDELRKYKEIEQELGVDLVTLFKALKNGIWTKGGFYSDTLEEKPVFIGRPEIGVCSYYDEVDENYNILLHDENVMCIYTYDYDFMVRQTRLKDYGKTWALTKEELS